MDGTSPPLNGGGLARFFDGASALPDKELQLAVSATPIHAMRVLGNPPVLMGRAGVHEPFQTINYAKNPRRSSTRAGTTRTKHDSAVIGR